MKNKIMVSVGISAYNEEKNIAKVLRDIISQKQSGWKLKEVLVYSDGSGDRTVQNAKSVRSKFIKIIDDGRRLGKTARLGELFQNVRGEILVMFDADIKIKSKNVISNLVKAFEVDNSVMLVGGNALSFPPKSLFQRAVYSTFQVFYQSRMNLRNGCNLFACTGAVLAARARFVKKIVFPKIKNDDTFLYFSCLSRGYKFSFVKNAIVYYKLPNTLSDYLAQVFRSNPEAVQLNLQKYFGDLVKKEYDRGNGFYAKNVLKVFIKDPLPVAYIIIVNLLSRPFFQFLSKSNSATWNAVVSTK